MSHAEWETWMRYRWRHGPMGPERMYDRAGALVAATVAQGNGWRGKMSDMLPWPRTTPAEDEMEALINEISGE